MEHQGTLLSGTITCTCGYSTGHYAFALDADKDFTAHLKEVGADDE